MVSIWLTAQFRTMSENNNAGLWPALRQRCAVN
jgi:hypothetical protein